MTPILQQVDFLPAKVISLIISSYSANCNTSPPWHWNHHIHLVASTSCDSSPLMPHPQNPSVQPPLNKPPSLSLPLAACCNDHQFATIAAPPFSRQSRCILQLLSRRPQLSPSSRYECHCLSITSIIKTSRNTTFEFWQ